MGGTATGTALVMVPGMQLRVRILLQEWSCLSGHPAIGGWMTQGYFQCQWVGAWVDEGGTVDWDSWLRGNENFWGDFENLCTPLIIVLPIHLGLHWCKITKLAEMGQLHDAFKNVIHHNELWTVHLIACWDPYVHQLHVSPLLQCRCEWGSHLHSSFCTCSCPLWTCWGHRAVIVGVGRKKESRLQLLQYRCETMAAQCQQSLSVKKKVR